MHDIQQHENELEQLRQDDGRYKCPECNKSYSYKFKNGIQKHLKISHQQIMTDDDIDMNDEELDEQINCMLEEDGKYHCAMCRKTYKFKKRLESHFKSAHVIPAQSIPNVDNSVTDPVVPTLIKLLYLIYDTTDAYKYGDGDRCMRNAKTEFLYMFSEKHTKYRLWLWRMLTYDMCVLSERAAMEYR